MPEVDNIYMVGPDLYKWLSKPILEADMGVYSIRPHKGCLFVCLEIPWDTIRTLCLYGEVFVKFHIG